MRVTVVRGGGIAGRVLEVSVDTADLDDETAARLRTLADAVDLVDRPPRGRPDGVRVELGVDDTRARFDEHDAPEGAADLVGWVLDCPAGVRTTDH